MEKDIPNTIQSPHYPYFHNPLTESSNFMDNIRSLFDPPEALDEGYSHLIPLGVSLDGSERLWNVEETPNLFTMNVRAIEIATEHALYWKNIDNSWEVATTLYPLLDIVHKKTKILRDNNVSHIAELNVKENIMPRTLYIYNNDLFNSVNKRIRNEEFDYNKKIDPRIKDSHFANYAEYSSDMQQFKFEMLEDFKTAFIEFERLGIHFISNVSNLFSSSVREGSEIVDFLRSVCDNKIAFIAEIDSPHGDSPFDYSGLAINTLARYY